MKDAILLDTAEGQFLTRLGQNYGVDRPKYNTTDDDLFRELVALLAWKPKMTLWLIYQLLEVFFGTSVGWKVFEIRPNEIIIEIHNDLYAGNLRSSTYLQQDPAPVNSNLAANVAPLDISIQVVSTVGYLDPAVTGKPEYITLDRGTCYERLAYSSIAAGTTFNLVDFAHYPHVGAMPVYQYVPEPDSVSYEGDYFGVATRQGLLAAPVLPFATTAILISGHNMPSKGFLWFDEGAPAVREKIYCAVDSDLITVDDYYKSSFAFSHAINSEVKYHDVLASHNEGSLTLTNNNPIMLSSDTIILDFLNYMDIVKAAGVEVTVKRIG
ncbi:MAG: hypothetical protein KKB59_20150 [Spirochaetes bacterium]|nr:hypothetical protein [Spirochaetota bacterium]